MLAPRDTPTRERKWLDGLWQAPLDAGGISRGLPAPPLAGQS